MGESFSLPSQRVAPSLSDLSKEKVLIEQFVASRSHCSRLAIDTYGKTISLYSFHLDQILSELLSQDKVKIIEKFYTVPGSSFDLQQQQKTASEPPPLISTKKEILPVSEEEFAQIMASNKLQFVYKCGVKDRLFDLKIPILALCSKLVATPLYLSQKLRIPFKSVHDVFSAIHRQKWIVSGGSFEKDLDWIKAKEWVSEDDLLLELYPEKIPHPFHKASFVRSLLQGGCSVVQAAKIIRFAKPRFNKEIFGPSPSFAWKRKSCEILQDKRPVCLRL